MSCPWVLCAWPWVCRHVQVPLDLSRYRTGPERGCNERERRVRRVVVKGRVAGGAVDGEPSVEIRRYRSAPVEHVHDFHQLVLPLAGALSMSVGSERGVVSERAVGVVVAGVAHRFTGSRGNAFLVVDIPARGAVADSPGAHALFEHAGHGPFVPIEGDERLLTRYLARMAERGRLRGVMVRHGCELLLDALAAAAGCDPDGAHPESLRRMCAYAQAHLEWPLTVGTLAGVAHLSPSRVHAQFRRHLGTTPMAWVTARRLARAAELLAHTALPVASVAERVGFADGAAFSRAFRRQYGTAPLALRRAGA